MTKISLPIEQDANAEKRERTITMPVDLITIEDWLGTDRKTAIPNRCKVTLNGQVYKVQIGKADLEKELEGLGVKIHRLKAI